ncbi:MAG TPA: hypothetical protein VNO32_30140 [Candidatus Acidoferrum sp.]|nr:hypothetical protein [Candidatus Acidoferrum sp.]
MFARLSRTIAQFRSSSLLTIRARIVILVIIVMAPIIGERIRGLEVGRADRFRMTGTQMLNLAKHGADVQTQMLSSARTLMNAAALTQTALSIDSEACRTTMEELQRASEFIDRLSIASPAGRIICSNIPELIGLEITDQQYFENATATKSFTVSSILIDRRSDRPIMTAALPKIRADGTTEFVVVSSLSLAWIEGLIAKLAERPNTSAVIVDATGALIARYPKIEPLVGVLSDHLLMRQIFSGPVTSFSTSDIDGVRRIFAAVRLGDTGAYLGVGIDESEVLKNINNQISIAYWVIAGRSFLRCWVLGLAASTSSCALCAHWSTRPFDLGKERLLICLRQRRYRRSSLRSIMRSTEWRSSSLPEKTISRKETGTSTNLHNSTV